MIRNRIALQLLAAAAAAHCFPAARGEAAPGKWTADFAAATNEAVRTERPLVMVWSKESCSYCRELESAVETAEFAEWRERSPYLFCLVKGDADGADTGANAGSGAKEFAQTAGGTAAALQGTPAVCLWFPCDGGTLATNFLGRSGKMPVPADGRSLARQLADSADSFFGDYRMPFSFSISGEALDRLEIEPGVTVLQVPLARRDFAAGSAAEGLLVATVPGAAPATNKVAWAAGETFKTAIVDFSAAGAAPQDGDTVSLEYANTENGVSAFSAAYCRARGNSVRNPHWIGERDAGALGFGEFTFDWAAATQKVASVRAAGGKAFTLAVWSGVLWCPYCSAMETSLFETQGDAPFANWAAENNAALVLFDQGRARASADDPSCGRDCPRLLSWTPDPNKSGTNATSGAAYMSRHNVDPAAAAAVKSFTADCSTNRWLAPETTAVRMSQPNILLVNASGKVAGRFSALRTGMVYGADENLRRLDDLLKLAEREDESDDYRTLTKRVLEIGGQAQTSTLQINDKRDFYRLSGMKSGLLTFTATGEGPSPVNLSYWLDGACVASGTGTLSVAASAADVSGEAFLEVSAFSDASKRAYFADGAIDTTAFDAEIGATFVETPGAISFAAASMRMIESGGPAAVTVTRSGGCSGEAAVRIVLDPSSSAANGARFRWTDTIVCWNDGEQGAKSVEIPLIETPEEYEGEQNAVFYIESVSGSARVSRGLFTLEIFDSDAPCLAKTAIDVEVPAQFAAGASWPVFNVSAGSKTTLSPVSGELPPGLSLCYDGAAQAVVLSGKPSAPGNYTAVFTISEERPDGTATGWETAFAFKIADPQILNGYFNRAFNASVPLRPKDDPSRIEGVAAFSSTSRGKLSMRLSLLDGRRGFSGAWDALDNETGMLRGTLKLRKETVSAAVDPSGALTVETQDGLSGTIDLAQTGGDFSAWTGRYNVLLAAPDGAADAIASGCGFLSIEATARNAANGTMKFAGILPDGTSVSGSALLSAAGDSGVYALLPVFSGNPSYALSAMLRIAADGKTLWASDETARIVSADAGSAPFWRRAGRAAPGDFPLQAYGSWFPANASPLSILREFELDGTVALQTGAESAWSEKHGAGASGPAAVLEAGARGFSISSRADLRAFSYNRRTGTFSGTGIIRFEDGRTASGTLRGILIPGWIDCGCGDEQIVLPFGAGLFCWRDTAGGKSVRRSVSATLETGN